MVIFHPRIMRLYMVLHSMSGGLDSLRATHVLLPGYYRTLQQVVSGH